MSATDDFGKHEVVHTAHIIHEMFAAHIQGHQAVDTDEDVRKAADEIGEAIAGFYQLVAQRF